jgi:predicted DCC family thiol-disulfide oxidoreductase YuxK
MENLAAPCRSSNAQKEVPDSALILYDGVCHLCQGFVTFIIQRDPGKKFRFGFLQSAAGQEIIRAHPSLAGGLNTVVLIEGTRVFTRSSAALRIARRLNGGWPLMYAFMVIPPFLRDALYDVVARHRYRWFGRSQECRLPSPADSDRFID